MNDIIFLDFDGVLNNAGSSALRKKSGDVNSLAAPDPVSVAMFETLLANHQNARVVITSTWRLGKDIDGLKEILVKEFGFMAGYAARVVGMTGVSSSRGEEISDFLVSHGKNIRSYVILDDDNDMLPEQWPFLVQTEFDLGFTVREYRRVDDMLTAVERAVLVGAR